MTPKSLVKLLNLHEKQGDTSKARSIAQQILESNPSYPNSITKRARLLLAKQRPRSANEPGQPDIPSPEELASIKSMDLFDIIYYSKQTGKSFESIDDAIAHYFLNWSDQLSDPSERFSTSFYLSSNRDVARAGMNPLAHYATQGYAEGRTPCPPMIPKECDEQLYYDNQFIPWSDHRIDSTLGITTCAFYLPQFHAIPENDAWWGKGFTEWTNVRKAQPLYMGHNQPLEPSTLGYYDLEKNAEIIRQQAKIANSYNIDAFCFYFYWFDGRTLLERPLQSFLKDTSIPIKFLLCWANENWTRTWDGLDNHILIEQNHTELDDLLFIRHITPYLRDPRYVRVDGKPVLVVYRPSLLPDAKQTASLWRNYCRDAGIGEICLAMTSSFDSFDPLTIDFDLQIEFAPNNMSLSKINPSDIGVNIQNFDGNIYKWDDLLSRSKEYLPASFPVSRCINPGWDNTPRKGNSANIVHGCTPRKFLNLAEYAVNYTSTNKQGTTGLLFINAWNEWAEGAILEPSSHLGYAYLSAYRQACANIACRLNKTLNIDKDLNIGIHIHAHYPELLPEILNAISASNVLTDLKSIAVTTQLSKRLICHEIIDKYPRLKPLSIVIGMDNWGRDIKPFLRVLRMWLGQNINLVLKLHTKKSLHREDGESWRGELIANLLSARATKTVKRLALCKDNNIGVFAPQNHLLPISTYFGSNKHHVLSLGSKLGASCEETIASFFPAGSMYWARLNALLPLITLVDDSLFEKEHMQTDGTLAHAIERIIGLVASKAGYGVCELSDLSTKGYILPEELSNDKLFEYIR